MNLPTTSDFLNIVLKDIPLIDVRAPIEFEKGAFLGATNLPIMNDEERHQVGICYKEKGNEEATKLGYRLVSGTIKDARIEAWTKHMEANPTCMMYCFRGGSRSRIAQEWIKEETGREIIRLEGGYKAFRNYLLDELEPSALTSKPIILGGYTGSGKTILLKQLENAIDLEGIANHRGSSFGQCVTPQPSQINFENNLAYALIKHKAQGYKYMILEDEGRHIGINFIPKDLAQYFSEGDLVVLEAPIEERVQITLEEYVVHSQAEYIKTYKDEALGLEAWHQYIGQSMARVQKRLGGDRFKQVMDLLERAYQHQLATGSYTGHEEWITFFLSDYYDPMYAYQLKNTTKKVVFHGQAPEVLDYLKSFK